MTGSEYVDAITRILTQQGNAQAAAAQNRGQIWGGTIANLGQLLGAAPQAAANQRALEQERSQRLALGNQQLQMGDFQLQEAKRRAASQQMLQGILSQPDVIGPDGQINISKLGIADPGLIESFNKVNESTLKVTEARQKVAAAERDDLSEFAHTLEGHDYQTQAGLLATRLAADVKAGRLPKDQAAQYGAMFIGPDGQPDEQGVAKVIGQFKNASSGVLEKRAKAAELLRPPQMTRAGLAADAANPKSPTQAQSATALDLEQKVPTPPKEPNAQHVPFMLDGKQVMGAFVPDATGGKYLFNGEDVTARARPIPPASVQVTQQANAAWSPEQVDFYAQQIKHDASKMNLIQGLEKPVKDRILRRITELGGDVNKISESSRTMAEMAKEILPHIDTIKTEAEQLNKLGLLGPIGSRWREFLAGKIGAGELTGGNPANAALIGKFKTDVGLLKTAVARAHGGARGGGSPMMLQHMNSLFGAEKADLSTLSGELAGFKDWMTGYANMLPGAGGAQTGAPSGARIYYDINGNRLER